MNVQVISADDGRCVSRSRYGSIERVWVREVVLRCADVAHPSILLQVTKRLADADAPVRAPGGGWDVRIGMEVAANAIWESPQMTGARAIRALRTSYEREIPVRPVR